MKYRPAGVPSARSARRSASSEITASRTRGVLPLVAVVHVSSTAPRLLECLLQVLPPTYSPRNGRRTRCTAQSRGAASSSPWASTQLSSEVTTSASTTPPSQRWPMFRHVPARRRHACSTRACLARSLRLSVCNIMASLHTTATFPGKVKLHSRRLSMRVYCVWMALANSLLPAGGRGTRPRRLASIGTHCSQSYRYRPDQSGISNLMQIACPNQAVGTRCWISQVTSRSSRRERCRRVEFNGDGKLGGPPGLEIKAVEPIDRLHEDRHRRLPQSRPHRACFHKVFGGVGGGSAAMAGGAGEESTDGVGICCGLCSACQVVCVGGGSDR